MASSPNDRESNIPPNNPISPDLAALREQIDRADHELLDLLARRQELVKEVAGLKRTTGVPIRDAAREASLLRDRRTHAEQLGLSSDVIESLFRLILWSSRDRQAALLTELPTDIEPATVTIVGGQGGMGQVFARLFEELSNEVIIVDRDSKIAPREAVQRANLVLISVPIDATPGVISEYAPLLTAEQALVDLTSTKAQPVETMLAESPGGSDRHAPVIRTQRALIAGAADCNHAGTGDALAGLAAADL
jgi:chorismate mutase/prephenate dehydrogenase